MKLKKTLQNIIVLAAACVLALFLAEAGSRLVLNPADYLSVTTIPDDKLGIVIKAGSPGFDKWGFRNSSVPAQVDIAAIGDSHTFGNTATMADSWPMALEDISGLSVYNLGVGGYGPNQYYYLFNEKALPLKPKIILCGLYTGDDYENAFSITYGLDYWSFLRKGNWDNVNADIWEETGGSGKGFLKPLRNWLAEHSIIYQLTFHGPVLGKIKGYLEIKESGKHDGAVSYLVIKEKNIREAFRPEGLLKRLDQKNPAVREGVRITFQLLKEMNEESVRNDIKFIVVVIPTKEMVFAEFLENNQDVHLHQVIEELIMNERAARDELFDFLRDSGIRYVDTLPNLRLNAGNRLYAFTDKDMHPGKNGYRVIAESIYKSMKDLGLSN